MQNAFKQSHKVEFHLQPAEAHHVMQNFNLQDYNTGF